MFSKEINVEHPRYKKCKPEEADACAWVYADKSHFQKYYYKLPPLQNFELEARVLYTGICHSDIHTGKGYWKPPRYPIACGHEIVAEVTKVGKDVSKFKVGEKVLIGCFRKNCGQCEDCKAGNEHYCMICENDKFIYNDDYWGGFSTHVQIDEKWVWKIPAGFTNLENIAPFMCAGITTYSPLQCFGKKGMRVGIIGIGGLGHVAVQYANKMGMEVTAFVHNMEAADEIKELGAVKIIDWTKENIGVTHKNYFDMILNTVPVPIEEKPFGAFLHSLKPRGRFVQLGLPEKTETMNVLTSPLVLKALDFSGSLTGNYKETEEMLKFSADNKISILCEHFDFENWDKAMEHLEKGKPHFRCVVDVHKFNIHS